jgi:hypothetical protein
MGMGENFKICRDPGLNRGPLDLQSNALPTELSRLCRMIKRLTTFIISKQNREKVSTLEFIQPFVSRAEIAQLGER